MKIKVLKTTEAASCPLGIKSKDYIAGETYEIFDDLANVFIKEGWGVNAPEEKAIEKALENKMIEAAPENKEVVAKEEKKEEERKAPIKRIVGKFKRK